MAARLSRTPATRTIVPFITLFPFRDSGTDLASKSGSLSRRIYAIFGLISMQKYAALKPDYSLSPTEPFTRVARLAMDIDRSPASLYLAGYARSEDARIVNRLSDHAQPSWLPDDREERLNICRQDVGRMLIRQACYGFCDVFRQPS